MQLTEFLSQHAVFTVDEIAKFLSDRGNNNPNTRKSLLTYYRKQGRIIPIRRGLYATVPFGADPKKVPVDPYLVASKLTADSVLTHHTALEFYGKAYSVYSKLVYTTANKSLPLKFQYYEYRGISVPMLLKTKHQENFGVTIQNRSGINIRVSSLERTLVDVLHRPDISGSWEEIWRSLETVEFFDLDQIIAYTLLLENATTIAKVGFFLEQHRETLMVETSHLKQLQTQLPKQPHYLLRGNRRGAQWIKNWNLMVPSEILTRSWNNVL